MHVKYINMNFLEMAYCIPYAPEHPRKIRCEFMTWKKMKNEKGCKRNFNGRLSRKLGWEIVQQITLEGPMNCFRELSNKFALEGCPIDFTETR